MTKTITKTTLAALALGMAAPAMAQSSGTFNASITLQNAPAATVAITGLDNLDFGTVTKAAGESSFNVNTEQSTKFCLTRSDAGNVLLTVTQPIFGTTDFALYEGGGLDTDADGRINAAKPTLFLKGGGTQALNTQISPGVAVPVLPLPGCSETEQTDDHYLSMAFPFAQNVPAGTYSAIFTVSVAAQ